MSTRKPVLLIDDEQESSDAILLLDSHCAEYLVYHIKKFEESCCVELPSTRAPAIFAPEGLFRGLDGIREYLGQTSQRKKLQSESAFW